MLGNRRESRGSISSTLYEARASLKEPSRPYTPMAGKRSKQIGNHLKLSKVKNNENLGKELDRIGRQAAQDLIQKRKISNAALLSALESTKKIDTKLLIAKTLLESKYKTILAARSVFELSRSPEADQIFQEIGIIRSLLSIVDEDSSEATLFVTAALKNLTTTATFEDIDIASPLARLIRRSIQSPSQENHSLLLQATGALRNICASHQKHLQSAPNILIAVLKSRQETAISANTIRALAKLSVHTSMRLALTEDKDTIPVLLHTFVQAKNAHQEDNFILVRLAFILGNLTQDIARNRQLLAFQGAQIFLDSFTQLAHSTENSKKQIDFLIKLIRLLANLSIDPTIGSKLTASTEIATSLVLILKKYKDEEELILNAVSALANLSYYILHPDCTPFPPSTAERLSSVLCSQQNYETIAEAARAFGNLSRDLDTCSIMTHVGATEALALLLNHPDRHVVLAVAGALVNLSVDHEAVPVLVQNSAHQDLIYLLRSSYAPDSATAKEEDRLLTKNNHELATVCCHALHNLYSSPSSIAGSLMEDNDARRLLSDSIEELIEVAEAEEADFEGDQHEASILNFLDAGYALKRLLEV